MRRRLAQRLNICSVLTGLLACGGGSAPPPPVPLKAIPQPQPCTNDSYLLFLWSPSGPITGEPRVMQASISRNGCVGGSLSGVPIEWAVAGGGNIDGQLTVRTLTDSQGIASVTWNFGPGSSLQTIEAEYRGGSTPLRVAISHTVLSVGPNRCATAGGTDLGVGRTITADETWTKAASPYFTTCATGVTCVADVRVANGAALTIEPGATVCVNSLRTEGAGRIVAAGTAAEPIFFGVRDRANHWKGLELQAPGAGSAVAGPSIVTHAVIENASDIKALGHPVIVEDTVMRRVVPAARTEHCAAFSIQPHSVSGVDSSRVVRTVIDGLGGSPCGPALSVSAVDNQPLTLSVRIINSRYTGMQFTADSGATLPGRVLLNNCEISGSQLVGLSAILYSSARGTPGVSSCNLVGNLSDAVSLLFDPMGPQLDARGNWWGDPVGPQGPKANRVFGNVDASNPLTAPVSLGY